MNASASTTDESPGAAPSSSLSQLLIRRALQVAWMSILLGIAMQLISLAVQAAFNKSPEANQVVADAVQKVTWSVFVCMGIGIGTVASRLRGSAMGVLGFISAPLGFTVAKALQKSTAQALSIASTPSISTPVFVWSVTLTKGLEYAVLGLVLAYASRKAWAGLGTHVLVGVVLGILFGSAIVTEFCFLSAEMPKPVQIAVMCANEFIFPLGCAMVVYFAQVMAKVVPAAK